MDADLRVALELRDQKKLVELIEEIENGNLATDELVVHSPEALCDEEEVRQQVIDYLKKLRVSVVFVKEAEGKQPC